MILVFFTSLFSFSQNIKWDDMVIIHTNSKETTNFKVESTDLISNYYAILNGLDNSDFFVYKKEKNIIILKNDHYDYWVFLIYKKDNTGIKIIYSENRFKKENRIYKYVASL